MYIDSQAGDIYNGDAMTSPLEKEFQFYLDHQDDMVAKYDAKFVVIKDDVVLGAYDYELTAVTKTQKSHEIGTFLVQKVSKGTSAYTQSFHSRAVFS